MKKGSKRARPPWYHRLSPLTWLIARTLVDLPDVAMVNLIAGRRLVPEYLQDEATPDALASELASLLDDEDRRREILAGYALVRQRLAGGAGVGAAAELALSLSRTG